MRMVFLDTNYLVALARREMTAGDEVRRWMQQGEVIATSSVAWAEFMVSSVLLIDRKRLRDLVGEHILPFGADEAECAARIFREAKCKRNDRLDAFIAATVIQARGALATRDRQDFVRFVPFGLKLASGH